MDPKKGPKRALGEGMLCTCYTPESPELHLFDTLLPLITPADRGSRDGASCNQDATNGATEALVEVVILVH